MDGSVASMLNYSSFMPTYDKAGRYGKDDIYIAPFSRIPARTDVVEDPEFSVPGIEELKPYLENTTLVVRPLPANSSEYINEMGAEFQKYVSDEISFDDYISKMQECMKTYFPDEVK